MLSVTLSLFLYFMECTVIALLLVFSLDTSAKITKAEVDYYLLEKKNIFKFLT